MFENILVPVDLTDENLRAIETSRDLALETGGEVTFIHVIETLDLPFEELAAFYDRLEANAVQTMRELAEPVRAAGVRMHQRIEYGKRAETIVEFAEENDVDLIILNSHRVRLDDPSSGWATLSYKIAILARCPVLLVKGTGT
jgi:nucleotide-binding universal stress UspA family protein